MIDDRITFSDTEQLVCQGARLMESGRSYFIAAGGPPALAVILGKQLYAPDLFYAYGDGSIDPQPDYPPHRNTTPYMQASSWGSMNIPRFQATAGHFDYGSLEAVQVDQYGNFNTTMRGTDYQRPQRRWGGAGGANEIASCCWRTILFMNLEKRRFVPRVEFITSPGFVDGSPDARRKGGLPADTGPWRVVTAEAVFGFDQESRRMELLAIGSWSSVEDILSKMSFEPLVATDLKTLDPPDMVELYYLRGEIDPGGRQLAGMATDFLAPPGGWVPDGEPIGAMDETAYVDNSASFEEMLERRARARDLKT